MVIMKDSLGRFMKGNRTSSMFKKGNYAWNKGKTYEELYGEEEAKTQRERLKKLRILRNKIEGAGHLGIKHNEKTKEIIRQKLARYRKLHPEHTKNQATSRSNTFKKHPEIIIKATKKRKETIDKKGKNNIMKNTKIEIKIQEYLKKIGIDFYAHHYIKNINHDYICDIFIPSMNLVIECDGDYWHKYPIGKEIDRIRTQELIQQGYKVLRLWEHTIRAMKINTFKSRIEQIK